MVKTFENRGMALSEWLARVIMMLLVLKSTFHKKTGYVFINKEYATALLNFLLVTTGMGARGKALDVPLNGLMSSTFQTPE